jgi:hypothetical protein
MFSKSNNHLLEARKTRSPISAPMIATFEPIHGIADPIWVRPFSVTDDIIEQYPFSAVKARHPGFSPSNPLAGGDIDRHAR